MVEKNSHTQKTNFKVLLEQAERLLEMPQIIDQSKVTFDDVQRHWQNMKESQWFDEISIDAVTIKPHYKFYSDVTDNSYFLVDTVTDVCVYRLMFKTDILILGDIKATRQTYVWKDVNAQPIIEKDSIVQVIFWNVLMKINGCMVTDTEQTPGGVKFWRRVVLTAIGDGLNVYHVNQKDSTLKQFNSIDYYDLNFATIYGRDESFQSHLLVVCLP